MLKATRIKLITVDLNDEMNVMGIIKSKKPIAN
jgi:hypothetical protein